MRRLYPADRYNGMRLLFLLQPGTNSRSIFQGLIRGFADAGHHAMVLELAPFWNAYAREPARKEALMGEATRALADLIRRERADATVAMWGNGISTFAGGMAAGRPSTVFDVLGVPHLLYWLDAPHWAAQGSAASLFGHPAIAGPMLLHAVNNEGIAQEMTEVLGFGRTLPIAYGVDTRVFRPEAAPAGEPRFDLVVSCGPGDPPPTAIELRELESDAPDMPAIRAERARLAAGAMRRFAKTDADRRLLALLLESQVRTPHATMLARTREIERSEDSLAGAASALLADPVRWVGATGAIRAVDQSARAFTIAWLSRRCRMAVFGAASDAWPITATRAGEIPFEKMSEWYGRGLAGLNVMRWQDDVGVNIKPLEIGASGRACLCARRAGLGGLLEPGREAIAFDTPDGALGELRALRDSPSRAAEIGAAARVRIERDHTWAARAVTLVTALAGVRGGQTPARQSVMS